jgi:hypothetical protein
LKQKPVATAAADELHVFLCSCFLKKKKKMKDEEEEEDDERWRRRYYMIDFFLNIHLFIHLSIYFVFVLFRFVSSGISVQNLGENLLHETGF